MDLMNTLPEVWLMNLLGMNFWIFAIIWRVIMISTACKLILSMISRAIANLLTSYCNNSGTIRPSIASGELRRIGRRSRWVIAWSEIARIASSLCWIMSNVTFSNGNVSESKAGLVYKYRIYLDSKSCQNWLHVFYKIITVDKLLICEDSKCTVVNAQPASYKFDRVVLKLATGITWENNNDAVASKLLITE